MTAAREHRLEGLEPDNLLAFLALLGLLRALKAAGLRPRAHWTGLPFRPVLSLPEAMTQEEVAERAAEGCRLAKEAFCFVGRNFSFTRESLTKLLGEVLAMPPSRAADVDTALSAFVVEGAMLSKAKKGGHAFERAPLDCLGGGQTDLFATLGDALKLCHRDDVATHLCNALFHPWRREYDGKALRWDQADFRQHAYAWRAPTADHKRQEWGANLLAVIGASAVFGCAASWGRSVAFLSLGSRIAGDGAYEFSWPIWHRAASLSAIQALLAHPEISADAPDVGRLAQAAVSLVYRSRKIWPTRYAVFTRAEAV
jgi:hypothetical protein